MSVRGFQDHIDIAGGHITVNGEHVEEVLSLQSEVSTAKFLQSGHIISHNLEAVANGLHELVGLVCGVVADNSEARILVPILKDARDTIATTLRHIDSAIWNVEQALIMVYRCARNSGDWHTLPTHLREFQNHSRRVHELWPHNRNLLTQELLPSLSGQFYSLESIFPHAALWVAQLTRSAQFFPRLQAWGQFPLFIKGICAALDPIPRMLDDVERYAVDLGEQLQLVVSKTAHFREEDTQRIQPILDQLTNSWSSYSDVSHGNLHQVEGIDPLEYLPFRYM